MYNKSQAFLKEMTEIKIWFKGYIKNDLKLTKAFEFPKNTELFEILVHCCSQYDLPVPVILEKHEKYFKEFSLVKFFKNDFVEQLSYDAVEVENFE